MDNTCELLIKAAKKKFAQHGYSGAKVKEIAKEAGVNISLISYHFGGKDGLYRACLEPFGKERLAFAEKVLIQPKSVEDMQNKLHLWSRHFLECHVEEHEITTILHRDCLHDSKFMKELFQKTFLKVFETVVAFLTAAKKKGFLRADIDAQLAASLYYGSLIHIGRTDKIQKEFFGKSILDKKYREQIIEQSLQILMKGIT